MTTKKHYTACYQQIRCELQINVLHTLSPGGSS